MPKVLLLAAADERDVERRERPLSLSGSLRVPGQPTHSSAPAGAAPVPVPSRPPKAAPRCAALRAAPLRSPLRSARLPR